MLYQPESVRKTMARLGKDLAGADPISAARRVIEVMPEFGKAYLIWGAKLAEQGELDEAEEVYWRGLRVEPCRAPLYIALSDLRTRRAESDVLAKRLRHLALWKLAFEDEISETWSSLFEPMLGARASEPEAYERLAGFEDAEIRKVFDPPQVVERLRPFRLLNDLQHEAPDELGEDTLQSILKYGAECEPVFRSALRQWAREPEALDLWSRCLLIAILGEISGPDAVDELLELSSNEEKPVFLHVHWAMNRLGMRFPEAVLARFRTAAKGANVTLRCALANQIDLMEDTEGDIEVLTSLLDGFEALPREDEENTGYLLASVVYALRERGEDALAKSLAAKWESKVKKDQRIWVREALEPVGDWVPLLIGDGVDGPDIDGVCLERYFLDGEEEEEEEEEDEPPPKPERNDPCWCGSGKKYKKCHLASDEEAEREEVLDEELDEEELPPSLHSKLMQEVFASSSDWMSKKDMKGAAEQYFGENPEGDPCPRDFNQFVQWLLHDYRQPSFRETPIEHFLRVRGPKLGKPERALLESLRDARFGLYEVERVESSSGVQLRDLMTEESRFVHDLSSSNTMSAGDALLARLQYHEGRWLFADDGCMVPGAVLEGLLEWIERERQKAGRTKADFVRANSHRLHRVVEELAPEVVDTDGEPLEFCSAEYEVLRRRELLEELRGMPDLAEEKEGSETFIWVEPFDEDSGRVLGKITVEGGSLRLEAQSRARLANGRRLIEEHAGALLKPVTKE